MISIIELVGGREDCQQIVVHPSCGHCKVIIQGLRSGCRSFFSIDPIPFMHAEPGGGGHVFLQLFFHCALQGGPRRSDLVHQAVQLQRCLFGELWSTLPMDLAREISPRSILQAVWGLPLHTGLSISVIPFLSADWPLHWFATETYCSPPCP